MLTSTILAWDLVCCSWGAQNCGQRYSSVLLEMLFSNLKNHLFAFWCNVFCVCAAMLSGFIQFISFSSYNHLSTCLCNFVSISHDWLEFGIAFYSNSDSCKSFTKELHHVPRTESQTLRCLASKESFLQDIQISLKS